MTRITDITREYREAGAVNRLLALWGFVDGGTFVTKAGHIGIVYRVKGIDAEALTHAQRQSFTHRIEAALRAFDPPVIARIEDDRLLLDVRTIFDSEVPDTARALAAALRIVHAQSERENDTW